MKLSSYIRIGFLSVFLLLTVFVSAQEDFKDEQEMAKKADGLFKKERYRQAFEYYQTLLSNHRENTVYSYRFGVCLMFSDKENKEKPIKYIETAAQDSTMDIKVFYYLGRVYHQNYRFTDAKRAYQKYKSLARSKVVAKFDINRRIQECDNGLALLSNIHLLYVINKVEVKEGSFYRTYNMRSSGGLVIMKPDNLITRYDRKHNTDYTAFYVPENRIIYYSSYGDKGANGKDIYRAHQLSDGDWSEPQVLSTSINTAYDEAYPFITPDGNTLYFSSKGHNSMGGFDIFKSTFNAGTFSWMEPENMNFPINTPFEDIFYVPDTSSRFANFSSTRSSVDGLIYVYKIGIDKKEEEQDFAKVLKDGGDVEAAIRLIKDVADMKTNINIDDYKQKMAVMTDSSNIAQTENTNADDKTEAEPLVNLSPNEAVDSVFSTYRELQYRVVGLKKQQKSIQKIYLKNKNLAEQIHANKAGEGAKEAAKYEEAAAVANKIDRSLSQEIASSEWAANKVIELASNMQYYQSNGEKDSVLSIYSQVEKLRKQINYNDEYAANLLIAQADIVKNHREKASKFYELSNSYEKEIDDLKTERDEYSAELINTSDESEKSEYKELIAEMDQEIAKKTAAKTTYIQKWKEERLLADNLSEQATYTNKAISEYESETQNINYSNYNYIDAEDIANVDKSISAIKTKPTTTVQTVDLADEPIIAQANVVRSNEDLENKESKEDIDQFVEQGSKLDSANAVSTDEQITIADVNLNNDSNDVVQEKTNYLENPESIALIADVDKNIAKLQESQKDNKQKASNAFTLGQAKYTEYQAYNNKLEQQYSDLSLNTKISSDDKIQTLQKLKKELVKANELKKQAAAAYSIGQLYNEKSKNEAELLSQAESNKDKAISYIEVGKFEEAQKISSELDANATDYENDVLEIQTKDQITYLDREDNQLTYRSDSLKRIIVDLKSEQKAMTKGSEAFDITANKIERQSEKLQKVDMQLDVVQSNKEALKQMGMVQKEIASTTYSKGNTINDSLQEFDIPVEMRSKDNLIAAFSAEKLDRQLSSIDESIAETRVIKEQTQIASYDEMGVLTIPNYATKEQNDAATAYVKPRVDAINEAQAQSVKLDKMIALSLIKAKGYNQEYREKTEELNKAYADIDTNVSLKSQAAIVDKVRSLELEQLELNQKQEVAIQYANILKKERDENTDHIAQLTEEVGVTKHYIARNQLDSANAINQQNVLLTTMTLKDGDFLADHLQVYKDENILIDKEIATIKQNNTNDIETAVVIDSLNAIKAQNINILTKVQAQANQVDDEGELAKVDSSMIARSTMVPIVAVNMNIFNPNYLQNHSLVQEKPTDYIAIADVDTSAKNMETVELDAAVITASRVNRNEIPYIKRELVYKELLSIDEEINVLTKMQEESFDDDEVNKIEGVIVSLNADKLALNGELKHLDKSLNKMESKGFESNFNADNLDVDALLIDMAIMKDSLTESSKQIRLAANQLSGKQKRVKISDAEMNEKIAFELGLDAVDIIAKRNSKEYHENNVAIAKQMSDNQSGFASTEAVAFTKKANSNKIAALERRKMLADGGYSEEEQHELISEAERYEALALENQKQALNVYETIPVLVQNTDSIQRTSEEIPYDEADDAQKERAQEMAANNESDTIERIAANNNQAQVLDKTTENMDTPASEADVDANNNLVIVPILNPSQKDSIYTQKDSVVNQDVAANDVVVDENTIYGDTIPVSNATTKDTIEEKGNEVIAVANNETNNDLEIAKEERQESEIIESQAVSMESQVISENNDKENQKELKEKELALHADLSPKEVAIQKSYGIKTTPVVTVVNNEALIPDNSELLPMGLVFKVQMAAFKRRVPPSTFKGISPIAAEQIPNSSYIRYVGGIFPNYKYAIPARNSIRSKGFRDAFIVAYFDGKRISIAQARRLIANGKAYTSNGLVQFAIRNNTQYYVLSKSEEYIVSTEKTSMGIPSIEENETVKIQIPKGTTTAGMGINYDATPSSETDIESTKVLSGLVFKVQIEALKQEVSLDYFKGINPIAKEKHSGSNLNFYVAGAFPNYISAAAARDHIHQIGYPSAFIVVYFNGERISLEDANQLIKEGKAFTTPSLAKYAMEKNTTYYTDNASSSVLTIYYSVQIGVFGSPRSANRLFNLDGLYFNRTNKGYYRYFAGKYSSEATAKQARDNIRSTGIKDAFVVVFQNGKRIGLIAARKIERKAKTENISINRNGAKSSVKSTVSDNKTQNTVLVNKAQSESGIVFKVQLGAYKGTRNSTQLKVINSMSENGISSYTTASGLTIYFTNSYNSYQEAKSAQGRIRAAGHTDVFVAALQNGSKISIRKALDILGKK